MSARLVLFVALLVVAPACVPTHYGIARATHAARTCPPVTLALLDFGLVFAATSAAVLSGTAHHTTGAVVDSTVAAGVAVADTWTEEVCSR